MSRVTEFAAFLVEREHIRKRRATGKPGPWTKDPILAKYKFTNVHREDDYTTRKLAGLYRPHMDEPAELMIYNAGIARYFGTHEFYEVVGWQTKFQRDRIEVKARNRLDVGLPVFTGAYVVTNSGRTDPKYVVVMDYLAGLWEQRKAVAAAYTGAGWQAAHEVLQELPGFGGTGFMAKEVMLDVIMMSQDAPPDKFNWTPVGPGARRGLNRMFNRDLDKRMAEPVMLEEIRSLRHQVGPIYSKAHKGDLLSCHDIQFQLCEFDKYLRVQNNEGRPRSLFKPRSVS